MGAGRHHEYGSAGTRAGFRPGRNLVRPRPRRASRGNPELPGLAGAEFAREERHRENPHRHLNTVLRVLAFAPFQVHGEALPRHPRWTLRVRTSHPRTCDASRRLSEGGCQDLRPLPRTHSHRNSQRKARPAIDGSVCGVFHRCMEVDQQASEAGYDKAKAGIRMKPGASSDTRTEWRVVHSANPTCPAGETSRLAEEVRAGRVILGLDATRPNDAVRPPSRLR